MTPLPAPLGSGRLVGWRLDLKQHAATWDSGEGAFRFGGRWNGKGVRAVYCSLEQIVLDRIREANRAET